MNYIFAVFASCLLGSLVLIMASNMSSQESEVLFECPICLLPFVGPVTLTCGHTYWFGYSVTARVV